MQVRKPVWNPCRGENHIGEVGAAVMGLSPGMVSGDAPERGEYEDGNDEPVVERWEDDERHAAARPAGNGHYR
jgi:hypothetical protein